jgi:hypothetical protein
MESLVSNQACRYTNKAGLQKLNAIAAKQNYNRQIEPAAIDDLPEDAVVALMPILVHEHAQGQPVPAHWRCFVFVDPDPIGLSRVMLDVPMPVLDRLPNKKELIASLTETDSPPDGKETP